MITLRSTQKLALLPTWLRLAIYLSVIAVLVACSTMLAEYPGECSVEVVGRELLRTPDEDLLYVEPQVLQKTASTVLLAGVPNYIVQERPGGNGVVHADSVLGVLVSTTGAVRTILPPIDGSLVVGVRAIQRSDSSWGFAFGQLEHAGREGRSTIPVSHLWYGEYDGTRWTSLESIPFPSDRQLSLHSSSSLVQHGDSMSWAMPSTHETFAASTVIVFSRSGSEAQWTYTTAPSRYTGYVSLAHHADKGLLLLAVHADADLGIDRNSLYLLAEQPQWHVREHLVYGPEEGRVHKPKLNLNDDAESATWISVHSHEYGGERRAMVMLDPARESRVSLPIDTVAARDVHHVTLPDLGSVWVTDRLPANGEHTIGFSRLSPTGHPQVVGRLINPFYGIYAVTGSGTDELTLSGPLVDSVAGVPLATLFLRAKLGCPRSTR